MIKDYKGNKKTPKILAQDIIMDKLAVARGYWTEGMEAEGLTDREIKLVSEQLEKECDRIAKRFNYNNSWAA